MRIKEGQMLELKNGQKIDAEEEIERFANVLIAGGLAYYLRRSRGRGYRQVDCAGDVR